MTAGFPTFRPTIATPGRDDPGNEARDPLEQNEYRHLPQCDLAIAGLNNAHCDRNSLVSVDTDDGAAQGALGAAEGPWAEKYPTKQESDR